VGTCVRDKGGDLSGEVTPGRSQSLHSTEAPPMREVKAVPSETRHRRAGEQTLPVASRGERKVRRPQPGLREGRQEGGCGRCRSGASQEASGPGDVAWGAPFAWTGRRFAGLGKGVKGNKWFSLMGKVHRPDPLARAWQDVRANGGAAGVGGQSIDPFAAREGV